MDRTKMFGHKRGGYSLFLSTLCTYCTVFKMSRYLSKERSYLLLYS